MNLDGYDRNRKTIWRNIYFKNSNKGIRGLDFWYLNTQSLKKPSQTTLTKVRSPTPQASSSTSPLIVHCFISYTWPMVANNASDRTHTTKVVEKVITWRCLKSFCKFITTNFSILDYNDKLYNWKTTVENRNSLEIRQ